MRHDTPRNIGAVAQRIEQAYARRHRLCTWRMPDGRLWEALAVALIAAHRRSSWLPIDPELFVAAQPRPQVLASPWEQLQPDRAVRRYRRRVRGIIAGLRQEVVDELRRVRVQRQVGQSVDEILTRRSRTLSPLGRYVAAVRLGRLDLAERLRPAAQLQHAACPLYRPALRRLLSPEAYPVLELLPGLVPSRRVGPPCRKPFRN